MIPFNLEKPVANPENSLDRDRYFSGLAYLQAHGWRLQRSQRTMTLKQDAEEVAEKKSDSALAGAGGPRSDGSALC
jgi:hypothetical protein